MADDTSIHSVVTTLTLMERMVEMDGPAGVTDLAKAVGVTKPRIYRHLRTLVTRGYVTQDASTEKYMLTPKLFHLGQAIAEKTEFIAEARRIMPNLRDQVSQTISIGQVEESGIRVLDILRHRSKFEISTPPGTLLDIHSSAQGKVALAFGPDSLWGLVEKGDLKPWTDKTNLSIDRLRSEVAQVKEQGWAVAPEEALIGINALAAPVFEHSGALAGMITIVGSVQHLKPVPGPEFVEALMDATRRVSSNLGWAGG